MTPQEFHERMKRFNSGDTEADHANADDLMCEVLKELGYEDGVKVFEAMERWYA